jgi:hypothetical protein
VESGLYRVIKCCIFSILLVEWKWLGWKNNKAEWLMTKWRRIGQCCGFTLSMVKQLGSAWNLFGYLKLV